MAQQDPVTTQARPAWATVIEDSATGTSQVEDGTLAVQSAILGLRAQLAAEFRALKLTLVSGTFVDTK